MNGNAAYHAQAEAHFQAMMNHYFPEMFVLYENGPSGKHDPSKVWVRFTILTGDSDTASLGKLYVERSTQVVHIALHTPKGEGTRKARQWAETMIRWFANQQHAIGDRHTIKYRAPRVTTKELPDGGVHQTVATVDGWRDETLTKPQMS